MIYYFSPYSLEGNLGKAYNDYCKLVPDDAWICLIDGDVLFLHNEWGKHFQDLVNKYPDTGLFTTFTNRVGNLNQCFQDMLSENSDLIYHRKLALQLQKERYLDIKELNEIISGHIMLFSKKTWQEIGGFPEELSEKFKQKFSANIATVDNRFSNRVLKAGKKILLAQGIYALHYYRLCEGRAYRDHLGLIKK